MKLMRIFRELKLQDNVEFMGEKFLVSTEKLTSPALGMSLDPEKELAFKAIMYNYKTTIFKYVNGEIDDSKEYNMWHQDKKKAINGHYDMLKSMQNNYKTGRAYWRAKHGRAI